MNDILLELRHTDAAPSYLRDIQHDAAVVAQIMARAADEIERLRTEVEQLKQDIEMLEESRDIWKARANFRADMA